MKITAGVPKRLARKREEGKGGIGYRRAERRQPDERRASPDNGATGPDAIGRDTAEGMLRRNAALCNVPMYSETGCCRAQAKRIRPRGIKEGQIMSPMTFPCNEACDSDKYSVMKQT